LYLHHYWTVAGAQYPERTAARPIQPAALHQSHPWLERRTRVTVVSGTFYSGGMPQDIALRNICFVEEVMPDLVQADAITL
jgi:hypothetical protein